MNKVLFLSLAMMSCLMISGCTIGPIAETRFVVIKTGLPIQILTPTKVEGRKLKDDTIGTQDITGWVAMPQDHFDALMRAAQKAENK